MRLRRCGCTRGRLKMRTYEELKRLVTLRERFDYLKLDGVVGEATFGYDRWLNQKFYTSEKWKQVRNQVILRDNGCDLGVEGYTIVHRIYIHHMNPITVEDLLNWNEAALLDPNVLICVSELTHNALHYGDASMLPADPVERRPFDTCPWIKERR